MQGDSLGLIGILEHGVLMHYLVGLCLREAMALSIHFVPHRWFMFDFCIDGSFSIYIHVFGWFMKNRDGETLKSKNIEK